MARCPLRLWHVPVALLAVASGLALTGWFVIWRSPPYYPGYGRIELPVPVMTAEGYGRVVGTHRRPYVVEIETGGGAVLLYGATHTKNPDDPQIEDLRRRWDAFEPTVALVEGRLGFLVPGVMDPVEHYGEGGALNALARRDGVKTYSWEPPRTQLIATLLKGHPRERVALLYVLNRYFSNLRHGKPDDPDAYVEADRLRRTQWPGLENTIQSVAHIDEIWARDFAGHADWRDTSDEWGLPGYLADIARDANTVRDEHFVRVIIDLARKGGRVFAEAGSSHAVKLDAELGAALRPEPSGRRP